MVFYQKKTEPGVVARTFNPRGGRGRQISEFEASLVYSVSSRTARATQRNPVSKNQGGRKKRKKKEKKKKSHRKEKREEGEGSRKILKIIKCLPSTCKALELAPNITKKKKC